MRDADFGLDATTLRARVNVVTQRAITIFPLITWPSCAKTHKRTNKRETRKNACPDRPAVRKNFIRVSL